MFIYLSLVRNFARKKRATDATQQQQQQQQRAIGARAFCSRFRHCSFCNAQNALTFLLRQA